MTVGIVLPIYMHGPSKQKAKVSTRTWSGVVSLKAG